jgi:hypothetical protein
MKLGTPMDNFLKYVLSFLILGAYFWLSWIVIRGDINATDPQKLLIIGSAYGSLSALAGIVVTYYYGSSKASADKDSTINSMAANIPVQPSTITATRTVDPSTQTSQEHTK